MNLTALVLAFACASDAPPSPVPLPPHQTFATSADAMAVVLASDPAVLGVGEFHAKIDGPPVASALHRFTEDLLPVLAPRTTDLVLETWVVDGQCGAREAEVTVQIEVDTKRPETTEGEIARLARLALEAGVQPHTLTLSCDDYAGVQGDDGEVVYEDLLVLLTAKLGDLALEGLGIDKARVVLYGGAVHNDLHPRESLSHFAYGPALQAAGGDRYTELDLYVPELVRENEGLAEEPWFALLDAAGPDHVLLYERSPRSFILIAKTTPLTP